MFFFKSFYHFNVSVHLLTHNLDQKEKEKKITKEKQKKKQTSTLHTAKTLSHNNV